jgi:DNA polymerase-3 subunit delta
MANLDEKKASEELRKGKIRSLYYFVAEDPFKLEHFAALLRAALFPEGAANAQVIFYGDELKPDELLDSVHTSTLWDPHKLILVRQAERLSAKNFETLSSLLERELERSTVVFLATKADARTKFIQALGKAKEHAVLVKLEHAEAGEWNLWVQSFLKKLGKELEDDARALLQDWTMGSLSDLKHALERASLFAGEANTIRLEHVKAVSFRVTPEEVYSFSTDVLSGDTSRALSRMGTLLEQGEEPIALVGLLARQYRWLLSILSLRAEGQPDSAIAASCKIFPGAARVLFPASKKLGGKGVIRGLSALAEADLALKSSRVPAKHVMTELLLRLTGARA